MVFQFIEGQGMKRLLVALVLALGTCSAWPQSAPLPLEHLLWSGRPIPFYGNPSSEESRQLIALVQGANLAERMASFTQSRLRLRHNLAIGFQDCGTPNAFYKPANRAVVICTEFVKHVAGLMTERKEFFAQQSPQFLAQWLTSILWVVYLHELSHAVIDINQVAITGREEDVADQFAIWASLNYINDIGVAAFVPAIWYFKELASSQRLNELPPEALSHLLSDEHSLQGQRALNFACWVHGLSPEAARDLTRFVALSDARAQRCGAEYRAMDNGIRAQFRKALKQNR
ncbi:MULTISPECIES: DUF4344 domain-containing metallopeptidase [unclassified Acidovorax]|uniref:DUF4344 domain-containing metallopeptidase n=1 Tax=unclassified Acidovorax TaxID=2684926 RepID=UPI000C187CF8|nr:MULTISPECIES: DUF4344 domain-containing metallopeptidase [unclassified Acidovorax]